MAIKSWLDVLNWKKVPHFSHVHELPSEDFELLYYSEDPHWRGFIDNILEGLRGENTPEAVRIEGPPGWGKTSCFYYVKIYAEKKGLKRHLDIININKIVSYNGVDMDALMDRCLNSLREYFNNCSPDKNYANQIFTNQAYTTQQKIAKLVTYLRENRSRFAKQLVIIIDDVDTVEDETYVLSASIEIFRLLNTSCITKWIAIRQVTYESYAPKTRERIDTLFLCRHDFPEVDLYKIIKVRVDDVKAEDGIMPFSPKLCEHVQAVYNGDHRLGLATLGEILRDNSPGNLGHKNANEEFIQRYIERMLLKVLRHRDVVPNLFKPIGRFGRLIPLAKEVMSLLYCCHTIDEDFMNMVVESIQDTAGKVFNRTENCELQEKDFDCVLDFLREIKLIIQTGDRTYSLTPLARHFYQYIGSDYYIKLCREELKEEHKNEEFWKFAFTKTPYRNILIDQLFGSSVNI